MNASIRFPPFTALFTDIWYNKKDRNTILKGVNPLRHSNFINIKKMEGELLLSQKRYDFGCTITTKELIFQKPHTSYQVRLEDIIGMVPFRLTAYRQTKEKAGDTIVDADFSTHYYKITVKQLRVINRNGKYDRGATDLIVPLDERFISLVERYAGFTTLPLQV